jgi:hypothetical protein
MKWSIIVTVNFPDGEEVEISFDVDDTVFSDLMGAVEYSMKKELPNYNRKIEEFSSLVVVIVPINHLGSIEVN